MIRKFRVRRKIIGYYNIFRMTIHRKGRLYRRKNGRPYRLRIPIYA